MPSSMRAYLSLIALPCMLVLPAATRAELPRIASINLCTDQLVLSIADPEQILSLSWLAADPEESMFAQAAAGYPLNHGSAEELIRIDADVVVAGTETSPFTRGLLRQLGARVVEIAPANSIDDIVRNLDRLGATIGRQDRATAAADAMLERAAALRAQRTPAAFTAVVVRPGGFTIGRRTLAFELLSLAGLDNSVADLDRWGSLSVETLLRQHPDYLVLTRYYADEAALANAIFDHPALKSLAGEQRTLTIESRHFACGAPASLDAVEDLLGQISQP